MHLICAIRTHASALSMDFSQSFVSLRQPCEGALHTPSSRQNLEAFSGIGSFHDSDGPTLDADQRLAQLRGLATDPGKDTGHPVAVLNVGLMHHDRDRQATRIGDDMALAALDLLACVIAARTAASVVFTDRPSITLASRPYWPLIRSYCLPVFLVHILRLHCRLNTTTESQAADPTQPFLSQALRV